MVKIALLINSQSGGGAHTEEIKKLLLLSDFSEIKIVKLDIVNIKKIIQNLFESNYKTIIAAGGDGTVSFIAGAIVSLGYDIKLGVLPVGTFNHFAKDLSIPTDIESALHIILKGNSKYVDIGKVNDIYFINNSSLGLYPKIVTFREKYQKKGWHKSIALIAAIFSLMRIQTFVTIEFRTEHTAIKRTTPFVFIGNNKYETQGLTIGERTHIDQGLLSVYVSKKVSIFRLFFLVLHALTGTLLEQEDFNAIGLQKCTISMHKNNISVSHDGEITRMQTPLQYEILPKALRVIIP